MSSGVNALAAVTLIDLVQPLYFRIRGFYIKENISAILTKILGNDSRNIVSTGETNIFKCVSSSLFIDLQLV